VTDFIRSETHAFEYLHGIAKNGHAYNGFNLLLADLAPDEPVIGYYTNNEKLGVQVVPPGVLLISHWLRCQLPRADRPFDQWLHCRDIRAV
jgi:uncharacterized protein with NRDE domain